MKIKRIMLQNIRSYDIAEIEFPDGNLLLSGDIGSGKSSILLGIEFALFGLQRGVGGGILLRNGQNVGGVKLELEIDGQIVKIERRLKRTKDTVKQDFCFIEVGGKKEQLSATELKSRVLNLLSYPQEFLNKNPVLYKYTVYTPQEEMKSILTEDSSLRLNTLRRVFGIDRYKRIIENSTILTTRIREQIKLKEGMVADLQDKKSELGTKKNEKEKVRVDMVDFRLKFEESHQKVEIKKKSIENIEKKLKEVVKIKTELASVLAETKMKKEQQENNLAERERIKSRINISEEKVADSDIKELDSISKELQEKEKALNESDKRYIELTKLI
ncbi:AAA family ATPase, partial [Nanoarchaeota archaeon]